MIDTDWSAKKLSILVKEVIDERLLDFAAVEGAVIWSLRGSVLIAQLRNATKKSEWFWLIGGENIATDIAPQQVASSPRELARYFSLRWQLGVEQLMNDPDQSVNNYSTHVKAGELRTMAERLYALAETEKIW